MGSTALRVQLQIGASFSNSYRLSPSILRQNSTKRSAKLSFIEGMKRVNMAILLLIAVVMSPATTVRVSGQITTACTATLISSFTPCLNYLTGSTNGGGSPTAQCCNALGSVVSTSLDCACLIVTGNVPFSLPINRTLAISLPRMCSSTSVPLQCTGSSITLPPTGSPIAYAPSLPPLPPFTSFPPPPPEETASPAAPSPDVTPADQGLNQGQHPLLLPNSAARLTRAFSLFASIVLVFGGLLF